MPYLILMFLLSGMVGGAWFYYTDTQERLATLRNNNAKLQIVAETNQETIENLQADYKLAQENMEKLAERAREAEIYQDELASKLRRHDLTRLTLQKPGLIEKRVNNATDKIFTELEVNSGAEPIIPTNQSK